MGDFFKDDSGEELKVMLDGDDIPEPFRGKDMKAALHEVAGQMTELETLRAKSQEQERQIAELGKKVNAPAPNTEIPKDPKERAKELAEKLEEDPAGTIQALMDERLNPLVTEQIGINVENRLEGMKRDTTKYPDFEKYEMEIKEKVKLLPLDQRSNPEVLKVVYDLVRVKDLDELKRKVDSGEYQPPPEPTAPSGQLPPSPTAPRKRQVAGLSDEEKKQMKLWGFKDEAEYRQWQGDGGTEGVPLQEAKARREEEAARQRMLGKR